MDGHLAFPLRGKMVVNCWSVTVRRFTTEMREKTRRIWLGNAALEQSGIFRPFPPPRSRAFCLRNMSCRRSWGGVAKSVAIGSACYTTLPAASVPP